MESLKVPKGSGSKSPGSIPLAIRFNADEESIEDILKPSESLSNSPQQNSDDFSWRKEFLQGNFFTRKRSGSIEATSSPGAGLISNLSSSDTNTGGTWKLIKGKVSQAMEDIKSSKSTQHTNKATDANDDSDFENATINSSMSDDFSLDNFTTVTIVGGTAASATLKNQNKPNLTGVETDTDSDIDLGPFSTPDDIEPSILRKSLANLRSKTTSSNLKSTKTASKDKKDDSSTSNMSNPSSIRSSFLRKRKKQPDMSMKQDKVDRLSTKTKKDIEIESGVEVLEGMILPSASSSGETASMDPEEKKSFEKLHGNEEVSNDKTIYKHHGTHTNLPSTYENDKTLPAAVNPQYQSITSSAACSTDIRTRMQQQNNLKQENTLTLFIEKLYKSRSFIQTIVLMMLLLVLPLPEFFRGVIACLFTISLFSFLTEFVTKLIERRNCHNGPEKSKFMIPDYNSMPICEIPAVEEHKPFKSYSGWMNEINNYDPSNYHISMTRSVFVRLDGSRLRISNTITRIPKRSMWNEPSIDKRNITFAPSKSFDLTGCRIEMCPRGLARKRHFSRKYPIQLIIKNFDASKLEENIGISKNQRGSPSEICDATSALSSALSDQQHQNFNQGKITLSTDSHGMTHQSSNESNEDRSEVQNDLDFGTTILNSNLQKLQDSRTGERSPKENVPCGDETRLLLFARCDREKEDWYRRFLAASVGEINDRELKIPDIVMVTDDQISASKAAIDTEPHETVDASNLPKSDEKHGTNTVNTIQKQNSSDKRDSKTSDENLFEGLLMTSCSARNPPEYIKFMSKYQKACTQYNIPVIKSSPLPTDIPKRHRRQKKQEDELWKGIDQSLYLGPSGSVVWANVLIGRILFGCLNDLVLLEKIQEFLQRKLSAIRLPSFMEDVVIAQVHLGDTPPLIHRVSQPLLDERGVWIDADVTYEGLMHMTITTKLNLLRLKRQQQNQASSNIGESSSNLNECGTNISNDAAASTTPTSNCAIYDSNAESSGASSTESESPTLGTIDPSAEPQTFYATPGKSRRLLRIVDRITASNLFQSATEISYIQRAMENMTTKITLRVELKGLVSRVVVNLPPPPSDRIWIAFRGPPRLWISAKPAVGDHTVDWSIVTNVIESKLCDEVYKYLVYPNMVDIIAPFLGQPTYKE